MKTKTIPFDLELAKKIQAGEIEGCIKTRDGSKARILCSDVRSNYPIVAVVAVNNSGAEAAQTYTANGCYVDNGSCHPTPDLRDLVLEVPDNEPQFKPFEQVLVRDSFYKIWCCDYFSHMDEGRYICVYGSATELGKDIVPFAGNEHLVGTTDEPK